MLAFIIVFVIVGIVIGLTTSDSNGLTDQSFIIIIAISVLWLFIAGPWAIATFIELGIGLAIADAFKRTK